MKTKRGWRDYQPAKKKPQGFKRYFAGILLGVPTAALLIGIGTAQAPEQKIPERPIEQRQEVIKPDPTTDEVKQYIALQAAISRPHVDAAEAMTIADCESDFYYKAKNPKSSAKGIYQFTDGTWKWIKAANDQYDWQENIKQFFIWYPQHPEWWSECLKTL